MNADESPCGALRAVWTDAELDVLTRTFAKVLWHYANHMRVLLDAGRDEQARATPLHAALERCLVLATLAARHRLAAEPTFSALDNGARFWCDTVALPPEYARPPSAEHDAPDVGARR